MDTSSVILNIAIILITARVFGEIVAYLGGPSVIGEIIAGILLGPTAFNLIQADGMIQVLAEIGIIMLQASKPILATCWNLDTNL